MDLTGHIGFIGVFFQIAVIEFNLSTVTMDDFCMWGVQMKLLSFDRDHN